MKRSISITFFFLTGFLFSQEFGSKFFTIDENSLPEVFTLNQSYFVQKHTATTFQKSMGITTSNYWKPVSMLEALNKQEAYLNRKNTVEKKITAESLGFRKVVEKESGIRIETKEYQFDRQNTIRNSVYRDASLPFLYNPYFHRTPRNSDF